MSSNGNGNSNVNGNGKGKGKESVKEPLIVDGSNIPKPSRTSAPPASAPRPPAPAAPAPIQQRAGGPLIIAEAHYPKSSHTSDQSTVATPTAPPVPGPTPPQKCWVRVENIDSTLTDSEVTTRLKEVDVGPFDPDPVRRHHDRGEINNGIIIQFDTSKAAQSAVERIKRKGLRNTRDLRASTVSSDTAVRMYARRLPQERQEPVRDPVIVRSPEVVPPSSGPSASSTTAQAAVCSTLRATAPSWLAPSATTTTAPAAIPPISRAPPQGPASLPVLSTIDHRQMVRIENLPSGLSKDRVRSEIARIMGENGLELRRHNGIELQARASGVTKAIIRFWYAHHARQAQSILPAQFFRGAFGDQPSYTLLY